MPRRAPATTTIAMSQALDNISKSVLEGVLHCERCNAETPCVSGFFLTTAAGYVMYPYKCLPKELPPSLNPCSFPGWTPNRPDEGISDCMTFVCAACLREDVVDVPKLLLDFTSQSAYQAMAKRTCTAIPTYMSVTSSEYNYAVTASKTSAPSDLTPLNIDSYYVPVDICGGFMGAGPYGLRIGQYVSYIAPNFPAVPSFGVLVYVCNIIDRLIDAQVRIPYAVAVIRPLGIAENDVCTPASTIVVPLSSVGPASNPVQGVLPLHYWLPDAQCLNTDRPSKADMERLAHLANLRAPHMDDLMAIDKSMFYYSWFVGVADRAPGEREHERLVDDVTRQSSIILNAVTYGALYEPAVTAMINVFYLTDPNTGLMPYYDDMVSPYGFYGVLHENATVKSKAALPLESVSNRVNVAMGAVFPAVSSSFTALEIGLAYDNTRPTVFSPPLTTRWTTQQLPTVAFGGPFLGLPDRRAVQPAFQDMINAVWCQTLARVADSTAYAALWQKDVITPTMRWQTFTAAMEDVQRARVFFSPQLDGIDLNKYVNPATVQAEVKASLEHNRNRTNALLSLTYDLFEVQLDGSVGLSADASLTSGIAAAPEVGFKIGDKVTAKYRGLDRGKWSPGTITDVRGMSIDIQYDDGDTDVGLDMQYVKRAAEMPAAFAHLPPMPPFVADMFVQHIGNVLTDGDARQSGTCPIFHPLFKRTLKASVTSYVPFVDVTYGTGSLHTAVIAAWNIYVAWKMTGVCGYIFADTEPHRRLKAVAPSLCLQYFAKEQAAFLNKAAFGLPDPTTLSPREQRRMIENLQFPLPECVRLQTVVNEIVSVAGRRERKGFFPVKNPLDMLYMLLFSSRTVQEVSAIAVTRAIWDLATKVITSRSDVCGLVMVWDSSLLAVPSAAKIMHRVMYEARMQKTMTGALRSEALTEKTQRCQDDVDKYKYRIKKAEDGMAAIIARKAFDEDGKRLETPLEAAKVIIENRDSRHSENARRVSQDLIKADANVQTEIRRRTDAKAQLVIARENLAKCRDGAISVHENIVAKKILNMLAFEDPKPDFVEIGDDHDDVIVIDD